MDFHIFCMQVFKRRLIMLVNLLLHVHSLTGDVMLTSMSCSVAVSDSLKLLCVTLDHTMSFNKHVSTVVRACNVHSSLTRSHSRSLAASWDPGWIIVTRC